MPRGEPLVPVGPGGMRGGDDGARRPGIGNGSGIGIRGPGGGIVLHFGDDNYWDYCMTNKQIVYALNDYGYSRVKIVKESNSSNKVWAIGRDGLKWYQMRVDRCTHKVDQVKRIYPINNGGNSFNLTFTF